MAPDAPGDTPTFVALHPVRPGPVDLVEAYRPPARGVDGAVPGRWVRVSMITSADGAVTRNGRSGGLGGAADRAVFRLLRSFADVVLVGAGTARAEQYRPTTPSQAGGRPPLLALVSRRLDLPWESPTLTSPDTVVVTSAAGAALAPRSARGRLVVAGDDAVDLRSAVDALVARRGPQVLCEGGPSLNGAMLAAGLVDEVCCTLAPLLLAGRSDRLATSPVATPTSLRLCHVLAASDGGADGEDGRSTLFLRYAVVAAHPDDPADGTS